MNLGFYPYRYAMFFQILCLNLCTYVNYTWEWIVRDRITEYFYIYNRKHNSIIDCMVGLAPNSVTSLWPPRWSAVSSSPVQNNYLCGPQILALIFWLLLCVRCVFRSPSHLNLVKLPTYVDGIKKNYLFMAAQQRDALYIILRTV